MHRTPFAAATVLAIVGAIAPGARAAQISINIAGIEIDCELFGPCAADQSKNSGASTLGDAPGYSYLIDGTVTSTGVLGTLVPSGSTIAEMLDIIDPGSSRLLSSYTRNFQGVPPTNVYINPFTGEFLGVEVGMTIQVRLGGTGSGFFEIVDIDIPGLLFLGDITINQGTCTIATWEPSPPSENEWHFDGDFSQAAGAPGAAKIRFLDDPAFGSVLGGQEGNLHIPQPSTPVGVSEEQSAFGTTASFNIAPIDGEEATVLRITPPRNLDDPKNADWRRGIGLALWPNTRPAYPGGIHGQWTAIYDILIPEQSWFVDYPTNTQPNEWLATLMHGNHNNDGDSSLLIRWNGSSASIGFEQQPGDFFPAFALAAGQWARVAIVCDLSQSASATIYVNGSPIGTTTGDWLYNGVDGSAPAFGDGEPVPPATWSAWGEFPSPWAHSPAGGDPPATLDGTVCLFADLPGRGEALYLSSFFWTDTLLTPSTIATLGSTDAAGILFTDAPPPVCDGDLSGDLAVNSTDLNILLASFAQNGNGDLDGDDDTDSADLNILLAAFGDVCN